MENKMFMDLKTQCHKDVKCPQIYNNLMKSGNQQTSSFFKTSKSRLKKK